MSHPLVISGMHRSGTSLIASVLQAAGLAIGCEIAAPGLGNPRGHFEDPDFLELHEEMLAAEGESCFSIGENFVPPVDGKFVRRAQGLVAARSGLPAWGWKDPRTCLFLDFWEPILPEARYLFLYRHPVDVALSLWRRNGDLELREAPWRSIRAWEGYNRRLLEFHDRHPERCLLAQVPAVAADLPALVRRVQEKLQIPLDERALAPIFAPRELTPQAPPNSAWETLIPEALDLYRRLDRSADLPAAVETASSFTVQGGSRDLVLVRASETLLYALLERCDREGDGATPALEQRKAYHRIRMEDEAAVALEFTLESGLPEARELAAALLREQERIEELIGQLIEERERCAAAEERAAELGRTLKGIEKSWSFAPIRAWWWLRSRLGGARQ